MASAPVKINEHIRQIESTRKEFFEEEKMKIKGKKGFSFSKIRPEKYIPIVFNYFIQE